MIDGEITDVAVCDDTVAVSIANNDRTLEGHVQYFLPFTSNDQSITKLSRVTGTYIVKDYITLQNKYMPPPLQEEEEEGAYSS
jgi:hypothetical protein